ncbi:MAG: DNA-processing protein DprA, partial [Candidatus Kapabacteria bacterium]|nr:DNA-processing protein DprA [Candidatus Kapabacteria bacterium]
MISENTKAILLLTSPLLSGGGERSVQILTPGEYKRLARHLRNLQKQPADLITSGVDDLIRACNEIIDENRLHSLVNRGFLLGQAIEHWSARAIWVVSRADSSYPRRIKQHLREDAPAIIYGCGDPTLLDSGGLAIVGSRNADESLLEYTVTAATAMADTGKSVVSGGARGVDQAAMQACLTSGGRARGVLADGLERAAMNRANREYLVDGRLVLISPFNPNAGFNVGNAMQRNKLIYALSDSALVVNADHNKGGTWAGAIEQLNKYKFVPVYVRSTGAPSEALDALLEMGARPWSSPGAVHEATPHVG